MRSIRQAAAIALIALVACGDDSSDPVDAGADASEDGGGQAGRGMDGGAGSGSAMAGSMSQEPRDGGREPSDSGVRDAEPRGQSDSSLPPMDAGDAMAPGDGGPDSSTAPGPDGEVGDGEVRDAQPDATPPIDAGSDEDTGEPDEPGLCASGSAGCVAVSFSVYADLLPFNGNAEIEVEHADATLEVSIVAGDSPAVWLPAAETMWIRTRAAGYWDDRVPLVITSGAATLDAAVFVFSSTFLGLYHAPFDLTVDETKGFVVVDFFANVPGAGVTLGAASDPPVVSSTAGLVQSATLVANPTGNLMLFSSVQPGSLDPMPVSPAGKSCNLVIGEAEYAAEPKTVLRFWVACQDSPP